MVKYQCSQFYLVEQYLFDEQSKALKDRFLSILPFQDLVNLDSKWNYDFIATFPKDAVRKSGRLESIEQLEKRVDEERIDESFRGMLEFIKETYNPKEKILLTAVSEGFRDPLSQYGFLKEVEKGVYEPDFSDRGPITLAISYILHKEGVDEIFKTIQEKETVKLKEMSVGERMGIYRLNELGFVEIDTESNSKCWTCSLKKFESHGSFNRLINKRILEYLFKRSAEHKKNPILRIAKNTLDKYLLTESSSEKGEI